MTPLYEVVPLADDPTKGELRFHFHAGQLRAWDSPKRFILVLAGTQGGKTSFGPVWLWREIMARGPGDYMVVTPTYPLLVKKALPEFLRLFKRQLGLGDYQSQQKVFTFSIERNIGLFGAAGLEAPTQIFFGHASDPESLESATAKACWLDEAGQKKFRLGSWEALQRRLAIHQGRALLTTTPYDLGWLKQQLWDPWQAARRNHPLIDVVRFDSTANPAFPAAEFERARGSLPGWKFDLFYRALFTRPAGLIYTSFDETMHKIPRMEIPESWPRFLGLDFGGVNTAGVFWAEERIGVKPTGRLIAYREYRAGDRSAAEHVRELMKGEPRIPFAVGGAPSEDHWRLEFGKLGLVRGQQQAGIPVRPPATPEVEVGIDRVYGAFARGELAIFDDLNLLLDELGSYSRELDDSGEPTEKIEDKETFHLLDATRYIIGYLKAKAPGAPQRVGGTLRKGF